MMHHYCELCLFSSNILNFSSQLKNCNGSYFHRMEFGWCILSPGHFTGITTGFDFNVGLGESLGKGWGGIMVLTGFNNFLFTNNEYQN